MQETQSQKSSNLPACILHGQERIQEALTRVNPMPLSQTHLLLEKLDGPSIVWMSERISKIIQRLCIQVKNVVGLKRMLVYTTNADDLAAAMKQNAYDFLFRDERLKIVLLNPDEIISLEKCQAWFHPTDWDYENETLIQSAPEAIQGFSPSLLNQIVGYHNVIYASITRGVGSVSITQDTFMGFQNTVSNIPEMLRSPDVRNLQNFFKDKPAFIVGAGPSITPQLEFLKKYQNRAFISSADTMLIPLTNAGIKPHIISSIERGWETSTLLDEKRDHMETLLLAASVLDPICFEKYRGPRSLYLQHSSFNDWLPFWRSRLGSGHSCVGLAMAIASHLGCNPMILIGIDLCWAPDGKSHMDTVPYLEQDFYKDNEKLLNDQAFETVNSKGEKVRTNQFWTLFHQQFQGWVKNLDRKVYNLSPQGLKLEGAEEITPENLEKKKVLLEKDFPFAEQLQKKIYYNVQSEREKEITLYQEKLRNIPKELQDIADTLQNKTPKEGYEYLEKHPLFHTLLWGIFSASMVPMKSHDSALAARSKDVTIAYLEKMKTHFEKCGGEFEDFVAKFKREKFRIY